MVLAMNVGCSAQKFWAALLLNSSWFLAFWPTPKVPQVDPKRANLPTPNKPQTGLNHAKLVTMKYAWFPNCPP